MTRWFVYVDMKYYPWGEFVEADTAEEASAIVLRGHDRDWATVTLPADQAAIQTAPGAEWRVEDMEHR